MVCNQNEKYLLKYISCANIDSSKNNDIVDVVINLGIKIKFKNQNPVYQIIDELNFENYKNKLIGKK